MSQVKRVYQYVLLYVYKFCGQIATDQVATNSTWTNNHILELWSRPQITKIIYPPVDTNDIMQAMPDLLKPRPNLMISFAQFRPEKDHSMQLRMWKRLLPRLPKDAKFWLVGTVRDENDQGILDGLKEQARELGIQESIDFKVNRSRLEILDIFSQAKVAIHTMRNEHFGIAVVELMAAGIVTIAHKSAGPLFDIIGGTTDEVGYLAQSESDYDLLAEQAFIGFSDLVYSFFFSSVLGSFGRTPVSGSVSDSAQRNSTRDSLSNLACASDDS
jgi:alpha-1,2-mannosyltransferase